LRTYFKNAVWAHPHTTLALLHLQSWKKQKKKAK
jgi:hypothetical protein